MQCTYRGIGILALAAMLLGACSDKGDDGGTGTGDTSGDGGSGTSDAGDDGSSGGDDGGTGSDDGGTGGDDGGTTDSETSSGGGTGTTTGGSTSETETASSGTATSSGAGASCTDVGGMCVVGSDSSDCPNGMGTNEASLTYPCLGPDEQCCVPIGWECHVAPDCFFQEWTVFTQGHWSCEDNDCIEVSDFCDEPPVPPCCGDDSCDHSYGENDQSCNADCA